MIAPTQDITLTAHVDLTHFASTARQGLFV